MKLAELLVLLVAVSAVTAPPPPGRAAAFSDRELECFAHQKVLYPADGKCHRLHHAGPCAKGQWLVFGEEEATPTLKCRTRPCTEAIKPFFWPEDGLCHKRSDKSTLCRFKGNELQSDSYGNGECACEKTYARHETEVLGGKTARGEWQWEGDCYPLFYRGPCPRGKLMFPKVLEGFGLVGICYDDYCAALNNASGPDTSYVMRRDDKKCYKLGKSGPPCASEEVFSVHPMTNRPECYSPANSLFSGSGARCGGNINRLTGECRKEILNIAQSYAYTIKRKPSRRRAGR